MKGETSTNVGVDHSSKTSYSAGNQVQHHICGRPAPDFLGTPGNPFFPLLLDRYVTFLPLHEIDLHFNDEVHVSQHEQCILGEGPQVLNHEGQNDSHLIFQWHIDVGRL